MSIKTVFALLRGELRYFFLRFVLLRKCKKSGFFMLARNSDFEVDCGARVRVGNRTTLESGSLLACRKDATLSLGDKVFINRNCSIVARESITLESGVTIGPNCCIYDHDHDVLKRGKTLTLLTNTTSSIQLIIQLINQSFIQNTCIMVINSSVKLLLQSSEFYVDDRFFLGL